jgi:hypothetical protein
LSSANAAISSGKRSPYAREAQVALVDQGVRRAQLPLVARVGEQQLEQLPDVRPGSDHPRAPRPPRNAMPPNRRVLAASSASSATTTLRGRPERLNVLDALHYE